MKTYYRGYKISSPLRTAGHLRGAEAEHAQNAVKAARRLRHELEAAALSSISSKRSTRWASLARRAQPLPSAFQRLARAAGEALL